METQCCDMILHILNDDKFTDYVVQQFSNAEVHSDFVVLSFSEQLKYVKEIARCRIVCYKSEAYGVLKQKIGTYKAVVFHGLFDPWCAELILCIPNSTKIAWVFWGGEIYGRYDIQGAFLSFRSKILLRLQRCKWIIEGQPDKHRSYQIPIECFRCVDFCLTDMCQEYDFAVKYLHHNMQMMWYNYYSIEETIGDTLLRSKCWGSGILLGNSATIENNHLDILTKLRYLPINGRELVVPLSYGASWYTSVVCRIGRFMFGKQFHPLMEFMSRAEYNRQMLLCSTMIMPHYRAQAQGNIITGLWLGMRVYLYERNFAYQYFKGLGIKIYSIEHDLNQQNSNVFTPMSEADIEHNRSILQRIYGREAMKENIKNIVKELSR